MLVNIETLDIDSDNLVQVDKLTKQSDGSYANSATITMTLTDSNGDDVSGAVDLTLSYVAASNGRYQGVIPSSVTLVENATYYLWLYISQSSDDVVRKVVCKARYRSIQ